MSNNIDLYLKEIQGYILMIVDIVMVEAPGVREGQCMGINTETLWSIPAGWLGQCIAISTLTEGVTSLNDIVELRIN
jgi:hypothetical protein